MYLLYLCIYAHEHMRARGVCLVKRVASRRILSHLSRFNVTRVRHTVCTVLHASAQVHLLSHKASE